MKNSPSFRDEPVLLLMLMTFVFVVGSKIAGWAADHIVDMREKSARAAQKAAVDAEHEALAAMSAQEVFEYFSITPERTRIGHNDPFFWISQRVIKTPISLMEWDEEIRCDTYLTKGVYMGFLERFVSSSKKMKVGKTGGAVYQSKIYGYPVLAPPKDAACRMTSTITATIEASDGKAFKFTQVYVTDFVYVGDYPEIQPGTEIFPSVKKQ